MTDTNFIMLVSPTGITFIAIGAALVVSAIIFLLYKFVIVRHVARKQVRELERRFEYLHALLIGQDAQYVKRLEIISRTNLLYVELHTQYLKRFKEIRDRFDAQAQNTINGLKDLVDEGKYKALKVSYSDGRNIIETYEKHVNTLNSDLISVVKPEEEARQASLSLKEELRRIKQDYYSKQGDLQLVISSFDAVYEYIDGLFDEFEQYVESAQYDDANTLLPNISKAIKEVGRVLTKLPNICALVTMVIPDKIASLMNAYEEMVDAKYPLHHLIVKNNIYDMNRELDLLTKKIKSFELTGVNNALDNIIARIDEYFILFEEEKKARVIFDAECEDIYVIVNTLEKKFIKLCNTIPEVKKIYVISGDYANRVNEIQSEINKVGATKRSLDTFIHSSTKQPYSILVSKMHELRDESNLVLSMMEDFQVYLDSLKETAENAYLLIYDYYHRVKKAEKIVRDISLKEFTAKYEELLERIYTSLNSVNDILNVLPIDITTVSNNISWLIEEGEPVLNEIESDNNMMALAESAILYANRDRQHLSDIHHLVLQSEAHFFNANFEKAYVDTSNALRKLRQGGSVSD
ncbi:MAG: septation ring formation regulator EzrA [Bacilli bacterium]|nr:septation ring formation regulator EzrA [Bacilli bacterium]